MVELSFTFIECLDIRDGLKKEITYLYGRINSRPELKEFYMSINEFGENNSARF